MNPYDASIFLYNIMLLPVIFFSALFLILAVLSPFIGKERHYNDPAEWPFVSVQIPTYNDPIAARCIEKCMHFDYPEDKYEIIIADDSTNIETQMLLRRYSEDNPAFVKYIHRNNREGFKPGALKNAMKHTKGGIVVIFDSDWIPKRDFLRKVVKPFQDENVALVQTRQGFYNHETNIITRFATYVLMVYHTIVMPITNKINCVFFCGTAGAFRRSAFEEVGGWNTESVTEDADLSVRLISGGYSTVYMSYETPSEVPDTFEGFIKQQMRWCYGNARVFFDHASSIIFNKRLSAKQKLMVTFITLSNSSALMILAMTFFGFAGWFLGEPRLFTLTDIFSLLGKLLVTGGFLFAGLITLHRVGKLREFKHMVLATFTMGLVLVVSNSIAFVKAAFNRKLHWYCTPKSANASIVKYGP